MAEYIERDKILGYMDLVVIHARGVAGNDSILKKVTDIVENMRHLVAEAPAAEVVPVVHGRWVQVICHVEFEDGFVDRLYECCSRCHTPNGRNTSNYCPNCGARMEEA